MAGSTVILNCCGYTNILLLCFILVLIKDKLYHRVGKFCTEKFLLFSRMAQICKVLSLNLP